MTIAISHRSTPEGVSNAIAYAAEHSPAVLERLSRLVRKGLTSSFTRLAETLATTGESIDTFSSADKAKVVQDFAIATNSLSQVICGERTISQSDRGSFQLLPTSCKAQFLETHAEIQGQLRSIVAKLAANDGASSPDQLGGGLIINRLAVLGSWYQRTTDLANSMSAKERELISIGLKLEREDSSPLRTYLLKSRFERLDLQHQRQEEVLQKHLELAPLRSPFAYLKQAGWNEPVASVYEGVLRTRDLFLSLLKP